MNERFQVAMEAKLALPEVALEGGDKLAAKDAAEHLDGKEERVAWLDPVGAIERQSAGGHHTMGMRVMLELLIPGVEHAEEADLGAEMFGIASNVEEGNRHWFAATDGTGFSCSARRAAPAHGVG